MSELRQELVHLKRDEDAELLMRYGVGFLAEQNPIGYTFIFFAGRIALQEKFQGFKLTEEER